jgi:iron complex outermembrane receptor protein
MGGLSLNHGVSLLDGRGFLNYTVDVSKVGLSNRAGKVSAAGEASDFEADLETQVKPFLARFPDARNINGSPETRAKKFLVNTGVNLDDSSKAYGNFAFIDKEVFSYANFRTPYWRPTDFGLLHPANTVYDGYGPTFVGKLKDYNGTIGLKSDFNGWNADVSVTTGGNNKKEGRARFFAPATSAFNIGRRDKTKWFIFSENALPKEELHDKSNSNPYCSTPALQRRGRSTG